MKIKDDSTSSTIENNIVPGAIFFCVVVAWVFSWAIMASRAPGSTAPEQDRASYESNFREYRDRAWLPAEFSGFSSPEFRYKIGSGFGLRTGESVTPSETVFGSWEGRVDVLADGGEMVVIEATISAQEDHAPFRLRANLVDMTMSASIMVDSAKNDMDVYVLAFKVPDGTPIQEIILSLDHIDTQDRGRDKLAWVFIEDIVVVVSPSP